MYSVFVRICPRHALAIISSLTFNVHQQFLFSLTLTDDKVSGCIDAHNMVVGWASDAILVGCSAEIDEVCLTWYTAVGIGVRLTSQGEGL